jgi:hypothetical protein
MLRHHVPAVARVCASCLQVSPKMRVEEVRNIIRDAAGILPALQRLTYAGEGCMWGRKVSGQRCVRQGLPVGLACGF